MYYFCCWLIKNDVANNTEAPDGVIVFPAGLSLNDVNHLASLYAHDHGEARCYIGSGWADPETGILTQGVMKLACWGR